jgi:hypothetical protein
MPKIQALQNKTKSLDSLSLSLSQFTTTTTTSSSSSTIPTLLFNVHGCLFCLSDNQKKASRLSQGLVFQSWNNNEEEEEVVVVVVVVAAAIEEAEEEEMMGCVLLTEFCNHFSFC